MKRWVGVLVLTLAGCSGESSTTDVQLQEVDATQAAAMFNAEGLPTVAFSVPNMMCEDSCVPTVRNILAKQPGVKDVEVVLETKTATVAVDEDQFDAEAAIAALLDMQFEDTKLITTDAATDTVDVESESDAPDASPTPSQDG